jgi:hypothetical protein
MPDPPVKFGIVAEATLEALVRAEHLAGGRRRIRH